MPVEAGEELELVMEAMSMGWTWALHFCNEGTVSCLEEAGGTAVLRDKEPAPHLGPGRPLGAVYVDNLTAVGGGAGDAQ